MCVCVSLGGWGPGSLQSLGSCLELLHHGRCKPHPRHTKQVSTECAGAGAGAGCGKPFDCAQSLPAECGIAHEDLGSRYAFIMGLQGHCMLLYCDVQPATAIIGCLSLRGHALPGRSSPLLCTSGLCVRVSKASLIMSLWSKARLGGCSTGNHWAAAASSCKEMQTKQQAAGIWWRWVDFS